MSLKMQNLDENAISLAIVNAQYALRELQATANGVGVLVLVNGMEVSGKSDAVKALREWSDPRLLKVHATTGEMPSDFQPIWQRHASQLPRHGTIAVYFGNWYADLLRYAFESRDKKILEQKKFAQLLADIETFETDLQNNGTHIIKCWFEIDKKTLKKRLSDDTPEPEQLFYFDWDKQDKAEDFIKFAEKLVTLQSNWHIIDGTDENTANLKFANLVLATAQHSIDTAQQANAVSTEQAEKLKTHPTTTKSTVKHSPIPKLLQIPLSDKMDKDSYKADLKTKQAKLAKLLRKRGQRHIVFMFEGMDAAGKGGAIKRIIDPLDPREYEIHPIAAPMQYELQHPYLWRFWTKLPQDKFADLPLECRDCASDSPPSKIAIFDRSWYGRVLVERIEGFASEQAWQRAYGEINRFEEDICQANGIVLKFWLAISNAEELKRFQARENTPDKQFKITPDDWRNREKWDDYVQVAADMLTLTDTPDSPWHIIATDDKYTARLMVLEKAISQLEKALTS